jgi:hypothetical protein
MSTKSRLVLLLGLLSLAAAATSGLASARTLPPCDDHRAARSPKDAPIELTVNQKRPEVLIALDDRSQDEADVTLTSKPDLGENTNVAAELNDTPARGARELSDVKLGAAPNNSGTGVVVRVCIGRQGNLSPGRYEGSLRIYGPTIKAFDYPLAVTVKAWKLWPLLLLLGGVGFAIVVAWWTGALRFSGQNKGRSILGYLLALVFMVIAGGAAYYSAYENNPIWGDDPGRDYVAIAIAGFSAASAALIALHRLLAEPKEEASP